MCIRDSSATAPREGGAGDGVALGKKPKWKMEHEAFQAALRAGRRHANAEKAGVPLSSLPHEPSARERSRHAAARTHREGPAWVEQRARSGRGARWPPARLHRAAHTRLTLRALSRRRAAPAENDTRVECPTCGRKFSDVAAERHIPKCADIRAKPKMLRAGAGGMSSSMRKGPGTGRW